MQFNILISPLLRFTVHSSHTSSSLRSAGMELLSLITLNRLFHPLAMSSAFSLVNEKTRVPLVTTEGDEMLSKRTRHRPSLATFHSFFGLEEHPRPAIAPN